MNQIIILITFTSQVKVKDSTQLGYNYMKTVSPMGSYMWHVPEPQMLNNYLFVVEKI